MLCFQKASIASWWPTDQLLRVTAASLCLVGVLFHFISHLTFVKHSCPGEKVVRDSIVGFEGVFLQAFWSKVAFLATGIFFI